MNQQQVLEKPTRVKVINLWFDVIWYEKSVENGAQKFGWCNCNDQVIGVSKEIQHCKIADTFLHEVIHALNWIIDIKDGVKEEEIANRLSSALCCFWIDNPLAFEWWSSLIRQSRTDAKP